MLCIARPRWRPAVRPHVATTRSKPSTTSRTCGVVARGPETHVPAVSRHHEQGGRLPPAQVSAGLLRRGQPREQPVAEVVIRPPAGSGRRTSAVFRRITWPGSQHAKIGEAPGRLFVCSGCTARRTAFVAQDLGSAVAPSAPEPAEWSARSYPVRLTVTRQCIGFGQGPRRVGHYSVGSRPCPDGRRCRGCCRVGRRLGGCGGRGRCRGERGRC